MEIVIGLIFLFYIGFISVMIFALRNNKKNDNIERFDFNSVTVLIAFRNELENLPRLLFQLEQLSFSKDKIDYLLVDDGSTDGGGDLVRKHHLFLNKQLQCLKIVNSLGKKDAIQLGVEKAKGEVIITTDADCVFNSLWAKDTISELITSKSNMILGGVKLEPDGSFFSKLQEVEFSVLMGITKATTDIKLPILANAANSAFYKKDFMKLNPYDSNCDVKSGDDIFLLHKMKQSNKKITFFVNDNSIVSTKTKTNFSEFIDQRVRWASKSKHFRDVDSIFIGTIILITNFAVVVSFVLTLIGKLGVLFFISLFLLKWVVDLIFIQTIPKGLRPNKFIKKSFLLSIVYPIYTVGIALLSLFYKPMWKDRKI